MFFVEHFFNNNDKPTKSSRMLRVKSKISFSCFHFSLLQTVWRFFFCFFMCFFFFHVFSFFFLFSFFHFFFFFPFSSVFQSSDETSKPDKQSDIFKDFLRISHGQRRPSNHCLEIVLSLVVHFTIKKNSSFIFSFVIMQIFQFFLFSMFLSLVVFHIFSSFFPFFFRTLNTEKIAEKFLL